MNEIITIQNYPLTILATLFCSAIIVIQFFGWKYCTIDPTFPVMGTLVSGVMFLTISIMPIKEHTQLHDISKFDVMETNRFVKIFDKERGSELFQTTDYHTITQIEKWTHVQHKWDTNIFGFKIDNGNYSLVQK
jgi:hypothetical protein